MNEILDVILKGLDAIDAATASAKSDAAIGLIRAIVSSLRRGVEGKVSADAVALEVEALRDALESNDGRALDALRKRFDQDDVATVPGVPVPGDE